MNGITAVMGRIQQIQSTISSISTPPPAPQPAAAPAPTPAAQDFATRMASFLQPATTTPATTTAASVLDQVAAAATTTPVEVAADPSGGAATGADVVAGARKYLGVPYVWGGESLAEGGLDCSGLVQLVFSELGVDMPRVARDQMHSGTEVPSLAQAQPGDLIVLRGGKHIGIYVGDNQMLHSPQPGRSVEIRELYETDADIVTIRRIVPAQAQVAAPGIDMAAAAQMAALVGGA